MTIHLSRRTLLGALGASAALPTLAACGGGGGGTGAAPSEGGVTKLRLAHIQPGPSAFGQAADHFAALAGERSSGRFEITVFPDGQLGDERDSAEGVQLGNIDIAMVNVSVMVNFASRLSVFDLPYVIESTEHSDKVFLGAVGDTLRGWVDEAGFKTVGLWESGFRNLTNNVRPINDVKDVAGLRIRVMENEVHQKLWNSLGADAVPMAWGEAYTALQQNALDGQENPLTVILYQNVQEVQKYLALTEHVYSMTVLVMSSKIWQGLGSDDQAMFEQIRQDTDIKQRELIRAESDQTLAKLEADGMEVSRPDKAGFVQATQPIRDQFGADAKELLDQIKELA